MRRYASGHVPDIGNPQRSLKRCSCGFLARTLNAVKAHAYDPQPDTVRTPLSLMQERIRHMMELDNAVYEWNRSA